MTITTLFIRGEPLHLVEQAHFTPSEARLIPRRSGGVKHMVGDINYTIRAFPNHHRALYSIIAYKFKYPKEPSPVSPECYLQRAVNFKPKDGTVRMLYGIYLHRLKKYKDSLKHYSKAESLGINSGELFYNMGLALYYSGKKAEAKEYAIKAKDLNYPLTSLYKKLKIKD